MLRPNTRMVVLAMLGGLMTAHLTALGFGVKNCIELSSQHPEIEERPFCKQADGAFQKAVETYIAVILALLAPISDGPPAAGP